MRSFTRSAALGTAVAVAVLAGCSDRGGHDTKNVEQNQRTGNTPKGTGPIDVAMRDNSFEPATITARLGDSVIVNLKNSGARVHTFTIEGLPVDVTVEPGNSYTAQFTAANKRDYKIVCRFHGASGMVATLTVS